VTVPWLCQPSGVRATVPARVVVFPAGPVYEPDVVQVPPAHERDVVAERVPPAGPVAVREVVHVPPEQLRVPAKVLVPRGPVTLPEKLRSRASAAPAAQAVKRQSTAADVRQFVMCSAPVCGDGVPGARRAWRARLTPVCLGGNSVQRSLAFCNVW